MWDKHVKGEEMMTYVWARSLGRRRVGRRDGERGEKRENES